MLKIGWLVNQSWSSNVDESFQDQEYSLRPMVVHGMECNARASQMLQGFLSVPSAESQWRDRPHCHGEWLVVEGMELATQPSNDQLVGQA